MMVRHTHCRSLQAAFQSGPPELSWHLSLPTFSPWQPVSQGPFGSDLHSLKEWLQAGNPHYIIFLFLTILSFLGWGGGGVCVYVCVSAETGYNEKLLTYFFLVFKWDLFKYNLHTIKFNFFFFYCKVLWVSKNHHEIETEFFITLKMSPGLPCLLLFPSPWKPQLWFLYL